MRLAVTLAALLTAFVALAAPADAACRDPATCSCTVSASGLSFGPYDPQNPSPTDSVGTITTSCVSQTPGYSTFSVALSAGGSADPSQRLMRHGDFSLNYNLYVGPTRTTIWGDDSGGGVSVVTSFPQPSGAEKRLNVYGRIQPRQNVEAGVYQDVVTITVTY